MQQNLFHIFLTCKQISMNFGATLNYLNKIKIIRKGKGKKSGHRASFWHVPAAQLGWLWLEADAPMG
jgi:hypothetical protein